MDPTTADFNAWLAEEGAKVGATVPPQPGNLLAMYGAGYAPADSHDQTTADVLSRMQGGTAIGNLLRSLAPEVRQADDSTVASGILSRLARTGTGLVHSGLNTAANWLEKRPEVGPDTLAPLGLAPMGMALTPRNAIGSAGGKLSSSLPMDEASRLNRAREMGFDTPAYHATAHEFSEFKPGWRGASFFASTPAGAERGASYGNIDKYGAGKSADRIMPVMLRSEYIKGLNLDPAEKAWWSNLPERAKEADIPTLMKDQPGFQIGPWYNVFDEVQLPDGTFEYVKKPIPSKTLDDVARTGEDVYGSKYLGTYEGEQFMAKNAKERGMDGFILSDEGGVSIGIADPTKIRSKYAAFNPSDSDKAGLLLSDQSRASVPGTIVNSMAESGLPTRSGLDGEILESPASIIRRGQQSEHWPENWFTGPGKPTERSQDALLDAARHALERDAADAWDAIVQPLRAKYGDKLRAEAEAYALRPDLGDALQTARREFMEGRKGRPLTEGEMMWEGLDRQPGAAQPTGGDLLDTVAREKFFVAGHPELSKNPAISSGPKLLKSDNARASVPGTVVNAQEDEDDKKKRKK